MWKWFRLTRSRRAVVVGVIEPGGIQGGCSQCRVEREARWDERIEGRQIFVGGGTATAFGCFLAFAALVLDEVIEFPNNASSLSLSLSFTLSFLELGRTGAVVLVLLLTVLLSAIALLKVKDLAEI